MSETPREVFAGNQVQVLLDAKDFKAEEGDKFSFTFGGVTISDEVLQGKRGIIDRATLSLFNEHLDEIINFKEKGEHPTHKMSVLQAQTVKPLVQSLLQPGVKPKEPVLKGFHEAWTDAQENTRAQVIRLLATGAKFAHPGFDNIKGNLEPVPYAVFIGKGNKKEDQQVFPLTETELEEISRFLSQPFAMGTGLSMSSVEFETALRRLKKDIETAQGNIEVAARYAAQSTELREAAL